MLPGNGHADANGNGDGHAAACKVAPSMGVFGQSRVMHAVLELSRLAAATRSGVLIAGERGTGREMVARTIHALSGRHHAPFFKVNCARSNGDLEYELFGTRGPARRDAPGERVSPTGLFLRAKDGTIFFERLGEMPTRVQARVVRLLRDGEAIAADTEQPVTIDVRIVASISSGFELLVQDGTVRADLYQRLSTIRIDVPPLRQRREDIPLLAAHFLESICAGRGLPVKTLTPAAAAVLSALPWPGNAHELQAVLQRLALVVPGATVDVEDVLTHVNLEGSAMASTYTGTLREARERFERDYISAMLDQCQGRMGETARRLGIQRTHLYRKVRSLQLQRAKGRSVAPAPV